MLYANELMDVAAEGNSRSLAALLDFFNQF